MWKNPHLKEVGHKPHYHRRETGWSGLTKATMERREKKSNKKELKLIKN